MKAAYVYFDKLPSVPIGPMRYEFSAAISIDQAAGAIATGQLATMAAELVGLRKRVGALEAQLQSQVVVLREITRDQAKGELKEFFRQHGDEQRYPSDAAIALRLDAALVRELCDELTAEGLLE